MLSCTSIRMAARINEYLQQQASRLTLEESLQRRRDDIASQGVAVNDHTSQTRSHTGVTYGASGIQAFAGNQVQSSAQAKIALTGGGCV